ncbi:helix-turn-helix domain-containing protein [Halomonas garicola]|uniref:helix-turn-helix domain-containing protein n=1 Tax=Halomonas garicola TaxID=1690008 RepID=UPI00289D1FFE|nr:XRE family transcriptional regulator [Halomonas garicola]
MLGQRIRQARLAADLTLEALGNELGVTKAAIQKYERGSSTPDSSKLLALAKTCGIRTEYFFRQSTVELSGIEFRKNVDFGKRRSEAARIRIAEMAEKRVEILDAFPESPIPDFAVPDGIPERIEALEDIEAMAERVRRAWHLGMNPIADLTAELESFGLLVMAIDVEHPGFSGMTATALAADKSYHVIAVSSRWPGDRQRFTLAHELAHIVLAGRLANGVDEEKACDRFAGAFLAPKEAVIKELGAQRKRLEPLELYRLKHEYGLSMMGWLIRAFQCGVIGEDTRLRTMKAFSRRGWRTREPWDALPAETPRQFEQLVYRALAEDHITETKAAGLLDISRMRFYQERFMEPVDAAAHQ